MWISISIRYLSDKENNMAIPIPEIILKTVNRQQFQVTNFDKGEIADGTYELHPVGTGKRNKVLERAYKRACSWLADVAECPSESLIDTPEFYEILKCDTDCKDDYQGCWNKYFIAQDEAELTKEATE